MRDADQQLKDRESAFLNRFRHALKESQLGQHLKGRPLEYEWVDNDHLLIALCDVESVSEYELQQLREALGVETYCTITPMHLNRLRVSFQCKLSPGPP